MNAKESEAKRKCIETLKDVCGLDDTEHSHVEADAALCEFLKALGHNDVVKLYEKVPKWFA